MLFERISAVELKQLEFQKKTEEKFDKVFEYISDHAESEQKNFNAQYPKLEVKMTNAFRDRFMVLDDKTVYHIGASIKDAGKKCFGITLIQDWWMKEELQLFLRIMFPDILLSILAKQMRMQSHLMKIY